MIVLRRRERGRLVVRLGPTPKRPGLSTMTPITLLIYIHVLLLLSYTINTPFAYLLVCYVSSMRLAICLWRASPTPDAPRELHDLMAKVSDAGLGSAVFLSYFVVVIFLKRFNILDLAPSISADSCQLMAIIRCFLTAMVCESLMMIEVHWAMIVQCVLPTTVVSVFCLPRSSSHEERRRAWSMVPTGESLLMLPHYLLIFFHRLLVVFYFFNPPFAYLLVRFLFITWTAISTFSREESEPPAAAAALL